MPWQNEVSIEFGLWWKKPLEYVGITQPISTIPLFFQFSHRCQNAGYVFNITFLFDTSCGDTRQKLKCFKEPNLAFL